MDFLSIANMNPQEVQAAYKMLQEDLAMQGAPAAAAQQHEREMSKLLTNILTQGAVQAQLKQIYDAMHPAQERKIAAETSAIESDVPREVAKIVARGEMEKAVKQTAPGEGKTAAMSNVAQALHTTALTETESLLRDLKHEKLSEDIKTGRVERELKETEVDRAELAVKQAARDLSTRKTLSRTTLNDLLDLDGEALVDVASRAPALIRLFQERLEAGTKEAADKEKALRDERKHYLSVLETIADQYKANITVLPATGNGQAFTLGGTNTQTFPEIIEQKKKEGTLSETDRRLYELYSTAILRLKFPDRIIPKMYISKPDEANFDAAEKMLGPGASPADVAQKASEIAEMEYRQLVDMLKERGTVTIQLSDASDVPVVVKLAPNGVDLEIVR